MPALAREGRAIARLNINISSCSMISATSLSKDTGKAFVNVPSPAHCGRHAAKAKDDWVDNEATLGEISLSEDFIGDWWNVPGDHLFQRMMALRYLDVPGMAF